MNNWSLEGKRTLVTGGTKGIGLAIVEEFLALGAEVVFTSRSEEDVEALEYHLRQQGQKAWGLAGDVANAADREQMLEFVQNQWGALDVLINNAGMNIRKTSEAYSQEEYRKVLEVNMIAPFEFSRLLFPFLRKGKGASIVNIASIAGTLDVKTGSPYAMSKAGLIQQSRSLAVEWASMGIRVNVVSPWFTETPLTEAYLADVARKEAITSRTPMARVAAATEIAGACAFMAMDKASYITGQNLMVDGGLSASAL